MHRPMCLCCLIKPGLSKDIQCHEQPYFSKLANHQIRHQATYKVVSHPGGCIWSLLSPPRVALLNEQNDGKGFLKVHQSLSCECGC